MRTILPSASLTLNELARVANSFEGHRGRPGQRGGSLPRSGSSAGTATAKSISTKLPSFISDDNYDVTPSTPASTTTISPEKYEATKLSIAAALKHEDPNVRLRAKAAKARLEIAKADSDKREAYLAKMKETATKPFANVPEQKEGETFTDHALRAAIYAIESADKLGRTTRGVLSGRFREAGNLIPFSDYLGITREEDSVSGRDMLQKLGLVGPNVEGFDWGDVAGFAVDVATDPLTYLSFGSSVAASAAVKSSRGATAAAQAARRTAKASALAKGATRYQATKLGEKAFQRSLRSAKAATTAAKPLKGKATATSVSKVSKLKAEALAAAMKKAVESGGTQRNPAASFMILAHELSKSALGSELLKRIGKATSSKMGKVVKATRQTKVPTRVKVLGKTVKTGLKRPTTVETLVKRARKATLDNPKVASTIQKTRTIATYLDQAHTVGMGALALTGANKDDIPKLKEAENDRKKVTTNRAYSSTQSIVVNYAGGVRKEKWQGRDYFVAPLSLIVEGVLNGSKGPLHYPMAEMKQNFSAWNGTPIVVYHPTDSHGNPLRAKGNPAVLNKSIGVVRNATIKHPKLVAEGWFDAEKTKEVDPRVYNALSKGQPMELSTGLHTDNEPANNGAHWNGRAYTHVARNYRPDHLAILPDQQGACSLNDGCGVLVNTSSIKDITMAKCKTPVQNEDEEEMEDNPEEEATENRETELQDYVYEMALVTNEWSDAARAAAIEARKRKFHNESKANSNYTPGYHKSLAQTYRQRAVAARKGGFLRAPNETTAKEHEEMAKLHETREKDPKYHQEAIKFHKQQAEKGGSNLSKGIRGAAGWTVGGMTGGAIGSAVGQGLGTVAGAVGGAYAGGPVGGAIGAKLGRSVGGHVGTLVGGTTGALLGASAGVDSAAAVAKRRANRAIQAHTRSLIKKPKVGVTNSSQENDMKLNAEDRAALVGDLTTNCDCWKYEGSEDVLNAMSDEQLVTLAEKSGQLRELIPIVNKLAVAFKVPGETTIDKFADVLVANAAAFDGSGEGGGGGDTRANGEGDDPDADYNDDGLEGEAEGDYDGDNQEQGDTMLSDPQTKGKGTVKNQRRKPMTTNQWLATAPPDVQVVVRNALRRDAEEKEKLIETITANANNEFSDEELLAMNTDQLRPIAKLASVTRNRAVAPKKNGHNRAANYFGIQGAAAPVFNEVNDEDLLEVPTMNQEDWAQNAKDTRN